jgi:hypothetical protein
MPVTPDEPAPYAPASAVIDIIKRHRNRGLPTPIDSDVLTRAGISASLIPRTLQALVTLDLVDDSGAPSDALEGIRLAPEAEYKQRVADWLRAAYADALQFVDPASATDGQTRDAFRNYVPIGQQDRMVTLFTGLFKEAGIGPERQRAAPRKASGSGIVAKPATRTVTKPKNNRADGALQTPINGDGKFPPAIAGLLTSLPPGGSGWSKLRRDQFLMTFGAVLDFCIPITEEVHDAEADTPSGQGAAGS